MKTRHFAAELVFGFFCSLIVLGAVVTACKTTHPVTLDEILSRPAGGPSLAAAALSNSTPVERQRDDVWDNIRPPSGELVLGASSLPAAFRGVKEPTGCPGSGLYLVVSPPRVGVPTVLSFKWPTTPGKRWVLLSSKIEPVELADIRCRLVGPSEWVFPLPDDVGAEFTLPAPPVEAAGSTWGVQTLQVDTDDPMLVRLSPGVWVRVGR